MRQSYVLRCRVLAALVALALAGCQAPRVQSEAENREQPPTDTRAVLRELGLKVAGEPALGARQRLLTFWPPSDLYAVGTVVRWEEGTQPGDQPPIVCSAGDYLGAQKPTVAHSLALSSNRNSEVKVSLDASLLGMIKSQGAFSALNGVKVVLKSVTIETLTDSALAQPPDEMTKTCFSALRRLGTAMQAYIIRTAWRGDVDYEYSSSHELTGEVKATLSRKLDDLLGISGSRKSSDAEGASGAGLFVAQIVEPLGDSPTDGYCVIRHEHLNSGENMTWGDFVVALGRTAAGEKERSAQVTVSAEGKVIGTRRITDHEGATFAGRGRTFEVLVSDIRQGSAQLAVGKSECLTVPNPPTDVRIVSFTAPYQESLRLSGGTIRGGAKPHHLIAQGKIPFRPGCSLELNWIRMDAPLKSTGLQHRPTFELFVTRVAPLFDAGDFEGRPALGSYRSQLPGELFFKHTFSWEGSRPPERLTFRQTSLAPVASTPWYVREDGGKWDLNVTTAYEQSELFVTLIGWTDSESSDALQLPVIDLDFIGLKYCDGAA